MRERHGSEGEAASGAAQEPRIGSRTAGRPGRTGGQAQCRDTVASEQGVAGRAEQGVGRAGSRE